MIPIGYKSCKRFGNFHVWKIALILTGISYLGLLIANGDAFLSLVSVAIISAMISLANISLLICLADFYDEVALAHRKRQEGIYAGFITMISRFGRILALVIIAIIQTLTLFNPEAVVQTSLAQFGILFTMSVIPAIAFIIAGSIIWRYWSLTPDRVESIKAELKELRI
jgi:Na+/melibiose symporter-like transporter